MTTATAPPPPAGLRREFGFRSTFSLAFAFISPIIGLYTIFGLALGAAGPAFWLGFAVVLGGQLLVALVLAELASVWPLAGGLYKWTQRLAGARIGWAAGWAYMWTLIVLVTAQCYAVAPFAASLAGIEQPSTGLLLAIGALILLAATAVNWLGPRALKVFVAISISAELLGSVVIGTVLLLFFREQPLSAVFGGGALVGALASATLGRASMKAMLGGTIGFSLSLLALAPLTNVYACAVLLFITGISFTLWTSNSNALIQLNAPDELRGRVVSLWLFAFAGLAPLGGLLAGWLVDLGGTQLAFLVAGAVGLAMAVPGVRQITTAAPEPAPAGARSS